MNFSPSISIKTLKNFEGLSLPALGTAGAAGFDLQAAIQRARTVKPLTRTLIPTGLCLSIPRGYEAQVRPRSGLALSSGVLVLNSPGTVDSDFRGEIMVLLANFGESAFKVKRGDRVAQLVFSFALSPIFEVTDILPASERGAKGFGSSGVASHE